MMRILITGSEGQLGRALQQALAQYDLVPLGRQQLDVSNAMAVGDTLKREVPDWVIHCAAVTDTTYCEREPAIAKKVNEGGAWTVAAACARIEAKLIAISTNEVFDGASRVPYAEDAERSPINVYGITKGEGERLALGEGDQTRVVRTSWVFGHSERNFIAKVLAAASEGNPLRFVTDEIAAPTSAADLAAAVRAVLEREAPPGIYHLANEGQASRYEWASAVVEAAGLNASVEPITTAELRAGGYVGPKKPPFTVLANNRARALGITLRPWRDALTAFLAPSGAAARG